MTFPVRRRGEFTIEASMTPDDALKRIARALEKESASGIRIHEDSVRFVVPLLRFKSNWNILAPIDSGSIGIRRVGKGLRVRYTLSLRRVTWSATLMIPLLFGPFVLLGRETPVSLGVVFLVAIWLWIVGGNYAIACVRFPDWLRKRLTHE